jgi:hypothetical protein
MISLARMASRDWSGPNRVYFEGACRCRNDRFNVPLSCSYAGVTRLVPGSGRLAEARCAIVPAWPGKNLPDYPVDTSAARRSQLLYGPGRPQSTAPGRCTVTRLTTTAAEPQTSWPRAGCVTWIIRKTYNPERRETAQRSHQGNVAQNYLCDLAGSRSEPPIISVSTRKKKSSA